MLSEHDLQKTWKKKEQDLTTTNNNEEQKTSEHTNITITAVEARYTPSPIPQPHQQIPNPLPFETYIVFVVAIGSQCDIATPSEFTYHDVLSLLTCETWSENHQVFANLIETYWQSKMTKDDNGNSRSFDFDKSTGKPCKKAKHIILPLSTNTAPTDIRFDERNNVRFKPKPFEIYSHEAKLDSLKWHITDPKDYAKVRNALGQVPDKSQPITSELLPERLRPNSFNYPVIKISTRGLCGLPSWVGTDLQGPKPEGASASEVQCYYQQNQNETHMKYARPGTAPNSPTIEMVLQHLPEDMVG